MSTPVARIFITTGPECSGKTTLATQLSSLLGAPLVAEASREYLTARSLEQPGYQYGQSDLLEIARLQHSHEMRALQQRPAHLVCDTDLLVIMIWSEVVFRHCDPALRLMFEQSLHTAGRRYLLCEPDIPWLHDPLRENPHDRDLLFARYCDKLDSLGLDYVTVTGNEEERLRLVQQNLAGQPRDWSR